MKLILKAKQGLVIAALGVVLTGCASNGGQDSGLSSAAQNVGSAVKGVASGIGSAVGGLFQPYRNGVQVTEAQLAQIEVGMRSAEVEQLIGNPPEIDNSNGGEIWSYPFSEITHFSGNINETTVVRFNTSGKVVKAYKTNSRSSATGNALVDAANGVN
ncbi:outer membrane protein assembly factor BamE [Marinobacter sp. M3C]|jgi:outer membrane protein assembly factor BamE (lipoprotein component of BamABCDE complex)|uniref:outer membrane protein assembly factor BamE domain-containing protein n=1 Tax=unclassified Marinobacter TaxID=83889 RepID=UPI00200E9ED7|nr:MULTISPECIES: outer membrane protein assembly factor BamE [unclassified Marinobacter]MCL1477315.1 outer membrane protein assembly factor BamE [Marinobacter sp.]MCL1482533.1 outer membrane protein assembly factor BamE [Marinobacter sp.]UQG57017.1 outer membrane protein assembly factor BamE [Marinobacter sp. M4C]UQG61786.1 outer membrane protein assembly factor BamE [Marinobacter sp. M3C]UQG65821.1 outer membrane protein assembly factor BamE [Marinobacter sp. M2C]